MSRFARDELIKVLACEIDERPEAPGPDALAPFIVGASLEGGALVISLDPAGRDVAEAFVTAEQVCCSNIGWSLEERGRMTLRITATEPQLKILAGLVPANIHIEKVL